MDYQIWLEMLSDLITPHVFKGLTDVYSGVLRITCGVKTLIAFQLTLEGIKDLSNSKITADFNILAKKIVAQGYQATWFDDLIKNLFVNYAKTALKSAGVNWQDTPIALLEIPPGQQFVHQIYINSAREIWQNPALFWHKQPDSMRQENNNKIVDIIKNSILRSVRESINLNKIIAYQAVPPIVPPTPQVILPVTPTTQVVTTTAQVVPPMSQVVRPVTPTAQVVSAVIVAPVIPQVVPSVVPPVVPPVPTFKNTVPRKI
jgi:hypothetical protein